MQCEAGPRRNANHSTDAEECNVRVVVRVRPLVARERLAGATESLEAIPGVPQIVVDPEHTYSFDDVFGTAVGQEAVFEEAVRPVIGAFLEGYNCTVLAYGQTGSGKTFTMGTGMGLDCADYDDDAAAGIIPRAVELILRQSSGTMGEDAITEMYVSFLEIYNEDIVDLLNPAQPKDKRGVLAIREDARGEIYIAGIREERVASRAEVLGCLQRGSLCRTTKSTQMNLVSSRSHAIFTLLLRQRHRKIDGANEVWESRLSKLHFVDLAGSERMKRTQAEGDRAKESIAINGGLLALGNVISALGDDAKRGQHVPYRDSKLTRLLQDSLGGNSRTLMIACVSPSSDNLAESLNTLKYAHRARNIKNRLVLNESVGTAGEAGFEIGQLKKLVAGLRQQIQQLRSAKAVANAAPSGSADARLAKENAELRARLEKSERERRKLEAELGRSGVKGKAHESPVKRKPLTGALRNSKPRKEETASVHEEELPGWFGQADSLLDRARTDLEQAQSKIKDFDVETDEEDDESTPHERAKRATRVDLAIGELQSDMAIKADLIQQVEAAKQEYLYMRERYEERLRLLQANLRAAQDQRDQAIQQAQNQARPAEKMSAFGVREMRERYEERIKRLGKQVNELKEAVRATSHAATSRATANDSVVRSLRTSLAAAKTENARLQAQLSEGMARLKTTSSATDTELKDIKARERKATELSAKWKKAHDFQKALLRKRIEQVMQARAKIRQLVALLRRHRVDIGSPSAGIDLGSPGWRLLQGDDKSPLLPSRLLGRRQAQEEANADLPMGTIGTSAQESPLKPKRILSGLHKSISAEELDVASEDSDGLLAEATSQMALDSSPFEARSTTATPRAPSMLKPHPPTPTVTAGMVSTALSLLNSPVGIVESLPKSILRASPLIPRRRDFFARLADASKSTTGPATGLAGTANAQLSFPDTPMRQSAQQKPKT